MKYLGYYGKVTSQNVKFCLLLRESVVYDLMCADTCLTGAVHN